MSFSLKKAATKVHNFAKKQNQRSLLYPEDSKESEEHLGVFKRTPKPFERRGFAPSQVTRMSVL